MIRRLAIASTLVVAGSISFASSAFAQAAPTTAEIPFEANVPTACTLYNIKPGTLKANAANTNLSTTNSGAIKGYFDILCTGSAMFSVTDPIQLSGPVTTVNNGATMDGTYVVQFGGNVTNSPSRGGQQSAIPGGFASNGDVWLDMSADAPAGQQLLGGAYKYKVVVTATPN